MGPKRNPIRPRLRLLLLQWTRDVAFAGFEVPLQMDVAARKMIYGTPGVDIARRDRLVKVAPRDAATWQPMNVAERRRELTDGGWVGVTGVGH